MLEQQMKSITRGLIIGIAIFGFSVFWTIGVVAVVHFVVKFW